jgi:hypothetical protein
MSKLYSFLCAALFCSVAMTLSATQPEQYQSIIPNTTLTAETSNNTAAANSFPGCEITTVTGGQ